MHIVLPGFNMQRAPHKGRAAQRIPLELYERRAAVEQIEFTDADLETGPVVGFLQGDALDTYTAPTDADKKSDSCTGQSDKTDPTWNDNDPKSGTIEDTGND